MQSGSRKQVDVTRLKADVAAAGVEILSARCAVDRIRLQYSPHDVVQIAEHSTLRKAITSAEAVYRYFALIELELKNIEQPNR
jgi:hypothetical protein